MNVKRKFSKITETKFVKKDIIYQDTKGTVFCIKFDSNIIPSFVEDETPKICIKNKDYIWFEFYPNEKSYLLTIMFDDKLNIIQWYFDVSKFVECNNCIPYQDDLYLDLVIKPTGEFKIFDEDELYEALQKKEITIDEFDYAYKILNQLMKKFANNYNYLLNLTNHILKMFEEEIKNGKI